MRSNWVRFNARSWLGPYWTLDLMSWTLAIPAAVLFRFDLSVPEQKLEVSLAFGLVLGLIQLTASVGASRIVGPTRPGTRRETRNALIIAMAVSLVASLLLFLFTPLELPRSVGFIAMPIAMSVLLLGRTFNLQFRPFGAPRSLRQRVLIYGAGSAGSQITAQMLDNPTYGYAPVAILDDDPGKRRVSIHGIRVSGTISDLERAIVEAKCDIVLVAIGNVSGSVLRELEGRCRTAGVALRVLPTTEEILGGHVSLSHVSEVREEDLLGRRPVHSDEEAIRDLLRGRRILITGAGGSIGSELARQVNRYEPAFLGLLDRDESLLHALQLTLDGHGLLTNESLILADIRDRENLIGLFTSLQPEVVFHAAALKHVTLLERFPKEGHATNVIGTQNVVEAAVLNGARVLVNVSTDKAADPVSVLGQTKLQAERLVADWSSRRENTGTRLVSVRFGNVLGSRGSVLPTFRYQITQGGPLTVTDPRVRRFFMTIPEAVHLMLNAVTIGNPGDTLVLDMGEQIKISDIAHDLVSRSRVPVEIVFTGLRPGEKLEETLVGYGEISEPTAHPLIQRITPGESTPKSR